MLSPIQPSSNAACIIVEMYVRRHNFLLSHLCLHSSTNIKITSDQTRHWTTVDCSTLLRSRSGTYLIFVISFTWTKYMNPKFTPQNNWKHPQKKPKIPIISKICSFWHSTWKILHQAGTFYRDAVCGFCDKYEVGVSHPPHIGAYWRGGVRRAQAPAPD